MKNPSLREQFLKSKWKSLPSVSMDFSDELMKVVSGVELYVGRLEKKLGQWVLHGGLWRRTFALAAGQLRIGNFSNDYLQFESIAEADEVLVSGDIVVIRVDQRQSQVNAVQLLVPYEGDQSPKSFHLSHSADLMAEWSSFLRHLRNYFNEKEFLEVSTPSLVISPGMEPHLEAFQTTFDNGSLRKGFYLPTSPEFHLKKLLSQGLHKIFEIKRCYRNGEIGPHHQPEFLMLEWYRAYAPLSSIAKDATDLFLYLQSKMCPEQKPREIQQTTMRELFLICCNLDLQPHTTDLELKQKCSELGIYTDQQDSWNDLFHRLFLEKVEPYLFEQEVVVVFDFPPQQMDLAKKTERGWSDRFEIYWKGVELCNAFHELNDWREQEKRFTEANETKKKLGLESFPVDRDFIESLKSGLPPSSGIALGVERLFMVLTGKENLKEAKVFAHDSESS